MRSNAQSSPEKAPWGIRLGAVFGLVFLHFPLAIIILYAFTTESDNFRFPPPALTTDWFMKIFERDDFWRALGVSLQVAVIATLFAMILGSLTAAALYRTPFFGREFISLLVLLPIALPGIVTGIALRSGISILNVDLSIWTIVVGHATFCIVTVYNNVVARLRRTAYSQIEASLDLGATSFQTLRYVVLPNIGTALVAGAMLAFALSFDEVIVTTFTSGTTQTLPIWILNQLSRPRDRPITNVAALIVIAVTFIPILVAYRYSERRGNITD